MNEYVGKHRSAEAIDQTDGDVVYDPHRRGFQILGTITRRMQTKGIDEAATEDRSDTGPNDRYSK